jgi:hypothetical protein
MGRGARGVGGEAMTIRLTTLALAALAGCAPSGGGLSPCEPLEGHEPTSEYVTEWRLPACDWEPPCPTAVVTAVATAGTQRECFGRWQRITLEGGAVMLAIIGDVTRADGSQTRRWVVTMQCGYGGFHDIYVDDHVSYQAHPQTGCIAAHAEEFGDDD